VERSGQQFPPHILPKGSPPPLGWDTVNPKNAWLVSDGYTLVAVYAGNPGKEPSRGRFAIIRQNLVFGIEYPPDLVDLPKAGALKITRSPRGASRERSAQYGELAFTSVKGVKGVLDLAGDRIGVARRR
jgi:hypothetical protein